MINENKIKQLEKKANILRRLRKLQNEILSNCAYSDKEYNFQMGRLNKLMLPQKEIKIISKIWGARQKLGKELLAEIGELIEDKEE